MKKLLWIGDAGCPSGFARATHEILETLRFHYDVVVLGMNYRGDPHEYPYPIWAAAPGGDAFGVGRLIWMCDLVKPDIIVLQNDPWNIQQYVLQLERFEEYKDIPIVAAIAVDGLNIRGGWLRGLAHAIFWTKFGLDEARLGGYDGPASVIPLGVDLKVYYPEDKQAARAHHLPMLADKFIVGNVNRNQPRKRWDLTVRYFAEWVRTQKVDDAYLYLHTAPTGDLGVDVKGLAKYYGVLNRLALMEPPTFYGISEDAMRETYNCFDVDISTTQGEGMGLTTLEAMACGVPCVVPAWSALGDWAREPTLQVPCTSTAIGPPYINIIGGVPDEGLFIKAIDVLYHDAGLRKKLGDLGLACARDPRYRWENIGGEWLKVLDEVLSNPHVPSESEWQDLGRPEVAR